MILDAMNMMWVMMASTPSISGDVEVHLNGHCGLNQPANTLAELIRHHPSQKRPVLHCNQLLTSIAQQRAEQLANNKADLNITPNQILIKGGFRVPNYYPVSGNQVEAVARGMAQADQTLAYLLDSGKHHDHVMGIGEFFALQSQIGIGYFKANEVNQHNQWVVMIAEPWESIEIVFKQQFNMPIKIAEGCDSGWQNSTDEFLKRKCSSLGRSKHKKEADVQLECDTTSCEKL